ncbi:MAG: hypothetical protein LBU24_03335 [Methanocalculaceae archaeon]|nr:hypothetical protein [Methanocalculaceae archaeon]
MIEHNVRRLPVTSAKGNVTGIVTARDRLSITNEINEIMTEHNLTINRPDNKNGRCSVCGARSARPHAD